MQLQFSKMHGLGNDFIVLDNVTQNIYLSKDKIRELASRNFGIGFDQLLIVEPPYDPDEDFHYRIFNADGDEVNQCGNGARCFARYVRMKGLTNKSRVLVSTKAGHLTLFLEKDGQVTVNMGHPSFEPSDIPIKANRKEATYIIRAQDHTVFCGAASIGNPHCLLEVDDIDSAPVETLGPLLESHERFPERVNVGFMQIVDPTQIKLRVYERGVGETLACGSGACAAVAIGHTQGKLARDVKVRLPGGTLKIRWQERENVIKMTGPAEHVFDGTLNI